MSFASHAQSIATNQIRGKDAAVYLNTMNSYTKKNFWIAFFLGLAVLIIIEYFAVSSLSQLWQNLLHPSLKQSLKMNIVAIIDIALLVALKKLFDRADNFFSGWAGETIVKKQLQKISPPYQILENIIPDEVDTQKKKWNIDFIVVGPKGISIVEVKSHSGLIYFSDGKLSRKGWPLRGNFIRQVIGQKKAVEKILRESGKFYPIHSYIVFSSPYARIDIQANQVPGTGITVIKKELINNYICGQKDVSLSEREIQNISHILKKYVRP